MLDDGSDSDEDILKVGTRKVGNHKLDVGANCRRLRDLQFENACTDEETKAPQPTLIKIAPSEKHARKRLSTTTGVASLVSLLLVFLHSLEIESQEALCRFNAAYSISSNSFCSGTGCEILVHTAWNAAFGTNDEVTSLCDNSARAQQFCSLLWQKKMPGLKFFNDFKDFQYDHNGE